MGDVSDTPLAFFECGYLLRRHLLMLFVELNWLVCKATDTGYYDLFLQLGSDTLSGKTCSNYQTIHLPCLC
jgi:hypothetical protein